MDRRPSASTARVAIIHDWLLGMRGGERCLEVMLEMFPNAELYTLFHRPEGLTLPLRARKTFVSPLGRIPHVHRFYRGLFPAYPWAVAALGRRLAAEHAQRPYDFVLSVSHCAAKNIPLPADLTHICYCLTPVRYLFDQYDSYFRGRVWEPVIRPVANLLRKWDTKRAAGVHHFIAISGFVAERIKRVYGRTSAVIYPPVRTDWIPRAQGAGRGLLCVCALVPYKNIHALIAACASCGLELTVVGRGPERRRLEALAAGSRVRFIDYLPDNELGALYARSQALLFAAEEDFGMTPVEMQAAGRPVIAFARGGALETVRGGGEKPSGVFFYELTTEEIARAIQFFMDRQHEFTVDNCVAQSQIFSVEVFRSSLAAYLADAGVITENSVASAEVGNA